MMDFQRLIAFRNEKNAFARRLGIVVEEIREGYARAVKIIDSDDTNPMKQPHGGVYFTLADVVSGSAMASYGYASVTLDADYHFLRSAQVGDKLTAVASVIRHGRTISTFSVQISDQNGSILGHGIFTFYRLDSEVPM